VEKKQNIFVKYVFYDEPDGFLLCNSCAKNMIAEKKLSFLLYIQHEWLYAVLRVQLPKYEYFYY
jgi:hypothetical protein